MAENKPWVLYAVTGSGTGLEVDRFLTEEEALEAQQTRPGNFYIEEETFPQKRTITKDNLNG